MIFIIGDILNTATQTDIGATKGAELMNCGELLSLPQAFG